MNPSWIAIFFTFNKLDIMIKIIIAATAFIGALYFGFPFVFQKAVQNSHIEGNTPSSSEFSALLERDLLLYFQTSMSKSVSKIEYRLLRDGPTQSGTSFPKYYLWAKVFEGTKLLKAGAVRVQAIDSIRFDVTNFLSSDEIRDKPTEVANIFPKLLVSDILLNAGVK